MSVCGVGLFGILRRFMFCLGGTGPGGSPVPPAFAAEDNMKRREEHEEKRQEIVIFGAGPNYGAGDVAWDGLGGGTDQRNVR